MQQHKKPKVTSKSLILPPLLVVLLVTLLIIPLSSAYTLNDYVYNTSETTMNSNPTDIFITPNGTTIYEYDYIYKYIKKGVLTQSFNISTLENITTEATLTEISANGEAITFGDDGNLLYVLDLGIDSILTYELSSSYNVSTANLIDTTNVYNSLYEAQPSGLYISSDGKYLFINGRNKDRIYKFNLTSNWNISTYTYDSDYYYISQTSESKGLSFTDDGLYCFVLDNSAIYGYNMTSPYNLSSMVYDTRLNFSNTNDKKDLFTINNYLYVIDASNDLIMEYIAPEELSTNYPPNIATSIKPSNTTITLNSTNQTININWSGGDDNNSDTVNTKVYFSLLGSKTLLGNTTTQSIIINATSNDYITSNYYKVYLNLSDDNNYTISEGETFTFCINEWDAYNTTCTNNLQTLIYNDTNNCPLTYDLPIDNGSVSACDIGSSGSINVTLESGFTTENILLLVIFGVLLLLWFITKNSIIGMINTFYAISMAVYAKSISNEGLIIVGFALIALVYGMVTYLLMKGGKD